MIFDLITAIIQVALCSALVGYLFHVIHRWSKLAGKISAICDDAADEAARSANELLTLDQILDMGNMAVWAESDDADDPRCGAYIVDDRPEFCGKPLVNCHHAISADEIKSGAYRIYRRKPEVCIGVDLASGADCTAYARPPEGSENDVTR